MPSSELFSVPPHVATHHSPWWIYMSIVEEQLKHLDIGSYQINLSAIQISL